MALECGGAGEPQDEAFVPPSAWLFPWLFCCGVSHSAEHDNGVFILPVPTEGLYVLAQLQ